VDALESEQLREASSADLAAANDTSTSLESVQAEGAETFASVRQELAEAEVCVMVLCDEAKKTLSKREPTFEVFSSEHGELQLKSQSVMTELEALKVKSAADAQATEEAAEILKKEATHAADSLEAAQLKLSESEALVASLAAERDALSKTLSDLETERNSLSAQKEELLERIASLEAELKSQQTQHSAELESAQESICAMKASEAEVKESLGSVRQDLADSEARTAALCDEYDASKTALSEKEVTLASLVSQTESLQACIQTLESELQEPQAKRDTETE